MFSSRAYLLLHSHFLPFIFSLLWLNPVMLRPCWHFAITVTANRLRATGQISSNLEAAAHVILLLLTCSSKPFTTAVQLLLLACRDLGFVV